LSGAGTSERIDPLSYRSGEGPGGCNPVMRQPEEIEVRKGKGKKKVEK